jgi:hypothetical protein
MRRISLALALVGAVAAGCGGAGSTATSNNQKRGVEGTYFTLTVRGETLANDGVSMIPTGGVVTSSSALNNAKDGVNVKCGVDAAGTQWTQCTAQYPYEGTTPAVNPITVTATNNPPVPATNPPGVHAFAGACSGQGACTVAMSSDRLVLVRFAGDVAGLGGHPNFSDPGLHFSEYMKQCQTPPPAGAYTCVDCHGANLQGAGLAPSCTQCHAAPAACGGTFVHPLDGSFGSPSLHAPAYLADYQTNTGKCASCHGANLLGTLGAPGCNGCHSWPIGPHMANMPNSSHTGGCARCHIGDGLRDYIGADTTQDDHELGYTATAGYAKAGALQTTFVSLNNKTNCNMCHNAKTALGDGTTTGTLSTIRFPSATLNTAGITVTVDTVTAICGQCHTTVRDDDRNVQGGIAAKLNGVTDVDAQLPSSNKPSRPHYLGAATTMLGGETQVYVQYGGTYTKRNDHGGLAACTACHNAHTGELPPDSAAAPAAINPWEVGAKCGTCHFDELDGSPVRTMAQIEDQRQFGFEGDIDQNGTEQGLKLEIEGLKAKLLAALKAYGTNVGGGDLCIVVSNTAPFLADTVKAQVNTTDACGAGANATDYTKFTARSLKASFNYMAIQNDPGAWAHNPRYVIEIIYDAIADLNAGLTAKGYTTAVVANGLRSFNGHFGAADAASKYGAFNHWSAAGTPPNFTGTNTMCGVCHSGNVGFTEYIATYGGTSNTVTDGSLTKAMPVTGMQCATCHALVTDPATGFKGMRTDVTSVRFNAKYGTKVVDLTTTPKFGSTKDLICATCHTGIESAATVATSIGTKVSGVDFNIKITSPHYLAAATVWLGSDAGLLWQYPSKTYAAMDTHQSKGCTFCHDPQKSRHTFELIGGSNFRTDAGCGAATCHNHRAASSGTKDSFSRNQNVDAMMAILLQKISDYAVSFGKPGLCFDGPRYSYWFQSTTNAGKFCDKTVDTTGYGSAFDPTMAKAAFNYFFLAKEPGAWAHNYGYTMQVLYDSIHDVDPTFSDANLPVDKSCIGTSTVTATSACDNGPGQTILPKSFGR